MCRYVQCGAVQIVVGHTFHSSPSIHRCRRRVCSPLPTRPGTSHRCSTRIYVKYLHIYTIYLHNSLRIYNIYTHLPVPSFLSPWQSPSYWPPLALQVYLPRPCRIPSTQSPSYLTSVNIFNGLSKYFSAVSPVPVLPLHDAVPVRGLVQSFKRRFPKITLLQSRRRPRLGPPGSRPP